MLKTVGWLQNSAKVIIESALDWISFASFQSVRNGTHTFHKLGLAWITRSMIIILECWALFNCSFYDESAVSTTSVTINFRENVMATLTNTDHKRKVYVIQKRQPIWSVCRTISDSECMMFIKVLLSTYQLLKPGFSEKKRTINWWVDLQLSWLKAKWVNSVVASNIFSNELVCVRKTKFPCLETYFNQSYEIWFA